MPRSSIGPGPLLVLRQTFDGRARASGRPSQSHISSSAVCLGTRIAPAVLNHDRHGCVDRASDPKSFPRASRLGRRSGSRAEGAHQRGKRPVCAQGRAGQLDEVREGTCPSTGVRRDRILLTTFVRILLDPVSYFPQKRYQFATRTKR